MWNKRNSSRKPPTKATNSFLALEKEELEEMKKVETPDGKEKKEEVVKKDEVKAEEEKKDTLKTEGQ